MDSICAFFLHSLSLASGVGMRPGQGGPSCGSMTPFEKTEERRDLDMRSVVAGRAIDNFQLPLLARMAADFCDQVQHALLGSRVWPALNAGFQGSDPSKHDASSAKAPRQRFVRGKRLPGIDGRNDVQNAAGGTRAAQQLGS